MGHKSFRSGLLALLCLIVLGTLPPSARAAGGILRTLRISRPSLVASTSAVAGREDPRLLGPGGARRYAGVVTQSEYTALREGDEIQLLSNATVIKNPAGCGIPTLVVSNDSIKITWPTECVDPGEAVVVQFTSPDSVTGCGSGVWRDGQFLFVANANCEAFTGLPALRPPTLAALIGLLALVGFVMLRRREASDSAT